MIENILVEQQKEVQLENIVRTHEKETQLSRQQRVIRILRFEIKIRLHVDLVIISGKKWGVTFSITSNDKEFVKTGFLYRSPYRFEIRRVKCIFEEVCLWKPETNLFSRIRKAKRNCAAVDEYQLVELADASKAC